MGGVVRGVACWPLAAPPAALNRRRAQLPLRSAALQSQRVILCTPRAPFRLSAIGPSSWEQNANTERSADADRQRRADAEDRTPGWRTAKAAAAAALLLAPTTVLCAAGTTFLAAFPARLLRTLLLLLTGVCGVSLGAALVVFTLAGAAVVLHATWRFVRGEPSARAVPAAPSLSRPPLPLTRVAPNSPTPPHIVTLLSRLGSALLFALPFGLLLLAISVSFVTPTAVERAAEALFAAAFGIASSLLLLSFTAAAAAAATAFVRKSLQQSLHTPPPPPPPPRVPPVARAAAPARAADSTPAPAPPAVEPEAPSARGSQTFETMRRKAQAEYFSQREWRRFDGNTAPPKQDARGRRR